GARAADVGVALDHACGAVLVDVDRRRRLAADVEPEARGDAAALIGAERDLHVRVVLGRFGRLLIADIGPGRPVRRLGAFLGGVDLAQAQRFDLQLLRQLVHAALDAVGRVRRAGGTVGRDLRAIRDDVVADD